jgi:acyl-coenzyme A thioesterase PaaI-like protein
MVSSPSSRNPFADFAARYADVPPATRAPLITRAIGTVIPFVDTAGCFIEAYTPTRVAVRLDNRTAVQNHLGGLHAAALALLAETASGLVVAINVPDGSAPLLRTMDVSFERYAREAVVAEATLSADASDQIQSRPVGQMDVDVTLTAPGADETLVASELKWAWLPEEKLNG